MRPVRRLIIAGALLLARHATAQQPLELPTRGTEFWLGFMQNAYGAQSLTVQIAARAATSGTVSMPLAGWSTPFAVAANGVATVVVPATAEHTGSEVVSTLGVLVQSLDSVTVTAVSFQSFTTDAAQVIPVQGIGTSYMVEAYRGLPGFADFYKSELLIVATQDNTEVEITPSVSTSGGQPAGVPFIVNLDAGETYQVQGALAALDLTGTTVNGTAGNGPCRPFAVFGGSMCANVPVACPACDHLFEQMAPTYTWGTDFLTIPVPGSTTSSYRITADQNGTGVVIDGGAPVMLNAGQSLEVNAAGAPVCISASLPVSVVQLMEGFNCSGGGDPSMITLVPQDGLSQQAVFKTITSAQITSQHVAVVMPSSATGTLLLDGGAVGAGFFTAYPACNSWSRAVLPVAPGTHTLSSIVGFIAYAVGSGTGESYAFTVRDFAPPVPDTDSLLCTAGPVTLSSPVAMNNAIWYEQADPGNVLATGLTYTFTPSQNGTYVVSGEMPVSQCPLEFAYMVGVPVDPTMALSANGASPAAVCQYAPVQLIATPLPDPAFYDLQWSPSGSVSDPAIPDPIAYPMQDTWFTLNVTSPIGCGSFMDSVLVTVSPNDVYAIDAQVDDPAICVGETVQLHTQVELVTVSDVFDAGLGTMWGPIAGGITSNACGGVSGDALYFNGAGARSARSLPLNTSAGGFVHFALKIGAGAPPCDDADPGEDIVLEYSTSGGPPFTVIAVYNEAAHPTFTLIDQPIPAGAMAANVVFQWRQASSSGAGLDNWAIDNVVITTFDNSTLTYGWTPAGAVSNAAIADPGGTPSSPVWFKVDAVDPLSGCTWSDSVFVDVQPAFAISTTNDTTICSAGPVQLAAVPNSGNGIIYGWTPNNGTLSSLTAPDPVATPAVSTTYAVTATTDIGCTAQSSTTITVGQLTGVNVTSADVDLCPGESTVLNAAITSGAPFTIQWTPNNGTLSSLTASTPVATPTTTTTYLSTVTDTPSGCQLTGSITVAMHGPYATTITPDDTVCSALGMQLNIAHTVPAPFTIAWSPASNLNASGIASPTILADTSATYAVSVTDQWGCSTEDSTTIAVAFDDLLTPVLIDACVGDVVPLDAGYPGSTYDWSTGATTQVIAAGNPGGYTVTITDAQLCQAVRTFNVNFHALPLVDLGPDTSLCGLSSLTLDANSPGNAVVWNTGATAQQINVGASGTYSVTATDPFGCSNVDSIAVTFNPAPIDVLVDVVACATATVTLDAGNAGSSYLWNTGATTQTIVVSTGGTYSVSITDPQGCTAVSDAMVTIVPALIVDLGPDTVLCQGSPLMLDAGNPGSTYLWNTGATTQAIAAATDGYYTVTVTNGPCTSTDAIDVVFNPPPVDVLTDVTQCVDQPITLDAGNWGASYLWSTGATTQQLVVPASGTYSVTVTTPFGCSGTFSATATYAPMPLVELGPDTTLCEGDVLTLNAGNPGAAFTWSNGAFTQYIDVLSSGTYLVQVDNGWCIASDALTATFNHAPSPLAAHEHYTCLDEEPHYVVIDAGNPGSDYAWSTGETSQVILAGAYGWYFVQVTTDLDCSGRDSTHVIEYCPPSIYVPNSFTPNGDGVNDVWGPAGRNIASLELTVFDRWGAPLFSTEDPANGWDGTAHGEEVMNGVYVWQMKYRFVEDLNGSVSENHEQLGHVMLLR